MAVIHLAHHQVVALLDADWLSDGPIRLNRALTLADLSGSLVLPHARRVIEHLARDRGVKLTATGNFNRKFVAQMAAEFRWPRFGADYVEMYGKVLNEPDFVPLNFLHAIIAVSGLGRKYKGYFRASRSGRSLLAPDAAGELYAVLFRATFKNYNLAYLDCMQVTDNFQPQMGLTLYLMSRVADEPRWPEDLMAGTTLPIDRIRSDFPFDAETVFGARVLRYLDWFGLLEKIPAAANDAWIDRYLFRKTPLFDHFLYIDVEARSPGD